MTLVCQICFQLLQVRSSVVQVMSSAVHKESTGQLCALTNALCIVKICEIGYKQERYITVETGYNDNSLLTTHFCWSWQNSYLLYTFDFGFSDTRFYDNSLLTTPLLHPREQNYLILRQLLPFVYLFRYVIFLHCCTELIWQKITKK